MKQMIEIRTAKLAASLHITDQVAGMTTAQTLRNIAERLSKLTKEGAHDRAKDCLFLATQADKHGCK